MARRQAVRSVDRMALAKSFTAAVMSAYWPSAVPPAGIRPLDDGGVAERIGRACRHLSVEAAAYQIGTTYTVMLPDDFRSRNGVFYTPPGVTARLLSLCGSAGIDWATACVLDPACGGGAFLAPVAMQMWQALAGRRPSDILRHIETHLVGFEIDPFSAWMSQMFLEAALAPLLRKAQRTLAPLVSVRDSLGTPEAEYAAFDLVIGNPPYGKVKLEAEDRKKWARSLYGHANLYGLFADLAVRMAVPGGVIAYVTPTGFLGGQYFKALRELLATSAPPVSIDFIAARDGVFADVLQEAMLSVCRKSGGAGAARARTDVAFTSASESGKAKVVNGGSYSLPADPTTPWLLPRCKDQADLARRLLEMPHRLGDMGWGVSTGPLVWNRHREKLLHGKAPRAVPLVWAECIGGNGTFQFRATGDHAAWYLPSSPSDSNVVRQPCVLVQRTTAPEQPRRLVAAEMPRAFLAKHGGSVSVENHLNMVLPTADAPRVGARTIAALLNSRTVDQAYRCISGSVAVSAYELEAMPLPPPSDIARLEGMIDRKCPPSEVEQAIAEMYAPTKAHGRKKCSLQRRCAA